MAFLEVKQITKKYQDRVVINQLSFSVEKGEFVAIIGPSGSGKSTVLNMLGLLETLDAGEIVYQGEALPKVDSRQATQFRRKKINYLFQHNALISNATVKANLLLALHFSKLSEAEKLTQINRILQKLGLDRHILAKVNTLSGGEQQRVAMARAILKPGELILADEPTGALDPHLAQLSFDLLKSLRDDYGKTVIVVTHNHEQAQQCDRIIRIESQMKADEIDG